MSTGVEVCEKSHSALQASIVAFNTHTGGFYSGGNTVKITWQAGEGCAL